MDVGARATSGDRPQHENVPSSARVWNYWQGGSDHGDVGREAGERSEQVFPGVTDLARSSRAFITRSVRFLAGEAGMGRKP